uniref:Si:ch211-215k15.4 n=1 Tax=Salmo trutta TaxID=8032 RepID=A0A673WD24_SALTR
MCLYLCLSCHSIGTLAFSFHSRRMRQDMFFLLLTLLVTPSENLALWGKATQSDLVDNPYNGWSHASNAIDGNSDSDFYHGSCTHTDSQTNPWWRVDLLDTYIVTSVTITNRGDCCHTNINGAEVHHKNVKFFKLKYYCDSGVISSIPAGRSLTLSWNKGIEGRYVAVVLPKTSTLVLCEVEVYGYLAPTGKDK